MTLLRVALGAWLMSAPWVLGDRFAPQGICDLTLGALTIALALATVRRPMLRVAFVPLSLGLLFAPFCFDNGTLAAMLSDILVGKILLALAAASSEMFE